MTFDLSSLDGVRAGVTAAAEAAAATLPLPAVVEAPLDGQTAAGLLPPDGGQGRAVVLNVRGTVTGTLVLVLADSLAQALENSPFGAQQLLDALGPALTDAGTALEQGGGVQVEAAHEVQPGIALQGVGDGRDFAAVPLVSGGEHVATLALLVDPAVQSPAAGPSAGVPVPEQREAAEAQTLEYQALQGLTGDAAALVPGASRPMTLLHDVEMGVTAELGRTRMTVRDLLSLTPGAVVELDRAAGSPVDVLVNGTLIARGEVVVIDEEYGIRISEIVGSRPADAGARR
jgi:flagellar motor switch protein FliN/FliY